MTASRTIETGTDQLIVSVDDGIAHLTFNNEEKRNAISVAMRQAIPGLLQSLQDNPGVRVVLLTGAGTKAFVSGGDISEFEKQRTSPEVRAENQRIYAEYERAWKALEKPIIAMIRGFCIGGGLLVALEADIRITSDDGQFGVPAAKLGLDYGPSSIKTVMNLVGPAWASEILFSGRRLSAEEALRIGLVNRVVSPDRLEDEVMELAGMIRDNAPLTVAACKAAIHDELQAPEKRNPARVAEMVEQCFLSADFGEGLRAFAEKRQPRFVGR